MASKKLNISHSNEKLHEKDNDSETSEYPKDFRLPRIRCVPSNNPRVPPGVPRRQETKPSPIINNQPKGKNTSGNAQRELWFTNRFERFKGNKVHFGDEGNKAPLGFTPNDNKVCLGLTKKDIKIPSGLAPIETKSRFRSEAPRDTSLLPVMVEGDFWAQRVVESKKQVTEKLPVGDPINTWARRVIEAKKNAQTPAESAEIWSRKFIEVKKGTHVPPLDTPPKNLTHQVHETEKDTVRPVIIPIESWFRRQHEAKAEGKIPSVILPIENKIRRCYETKTDFKITPGVTPNEIWRQAEEKRCIGVPPRFQPIGNRFRPNDEGMKEAKGLPGITPLSYGTCSGFEENRTIRFPAGLSPIKNYPRTGFESLEGNMRLEGKKTVQIAPGLNLLEKTVSPKFPDNDV